MITLSTARRLRDGGVRWTPTSGDRFVVSERGMDDEVFTLSDMTVEVHRFPGEQVIGFNGTVEWALDSIEMEQAVWLPSEAQLRELLAGTFRRLERDTNGFQVSIEIDGRPVSACDADASEAYARALLHLVTGDDVTSQLVAGDDPHG